MKPVIVPKAQFMDQLVEQIKKGVTEADPSIEIVRVEWVKEGLKVWMMRRN